jgi:hypothetical protein
VLDLNLMVSFYTYFLIIDNPSKTCPPKGYRPERSSDLSADNL